MAALPEIKVTLDVLNDKPFITQMQRAIDLCAVAERCIEQFENGQCPQFGALKEATQEFRQWFDSED
jgi:hypothetical protein